MVRIFKIIALLLSISALASAAPNTFRVIGTSAACWTKVLGTVGIAPATGEQARIVVVGGDAEADVVSLSQQHLVIIEGLGRAAAQAGIQGLAGTAAVRQERDEHAPAMEIVWERPAEIHPAQLPSGFRLFSREPLSGAPLLAGKQTEGGAILWMATPPGPVATERYPYLLHALSDLGLLLPARAADLWAFFDSSYRLRADVDYLARRWREAGIAVLQVAAWHNMERDAEADRYLERLIAACHNHAILVYAWFELPHVSDRFWEEHPEWREKTALGQDAQLDWRKLMNLRDPACVSAARRLTQDLLHRFDWDGVNLAELYFESLEGIGNPARFTPMNQAVRADFIAREGFDPIELFRPKSPFAHNNAATRRFLDYRAGLAAQLQTDWLTAVAEVRSTLPHLDLVLTHIDDRFEPDIRDALGADVARSVPAINRQRATLLVEDPAPLWNLGPERYAKIADQYRKLAATPRRLAVDINVVERYQDVYPTKKQTGLELLALVHQAASSFQTVALYFENSIEKQDLPLLPAAAAAGVVQEVAADEWQVRARRPTKVLWRGPTEIDGQLWPLQDGRQVLVPAGTHRLRPAVAAPPFTMTDFNGELRTAHIHHRVIEIAYESRSRSIATFTKPITVVTVDGQEFSGSGARRAAHAPVLLPAGQHVATFEAAD